MDGQNTGRELVEASSRTRHLQGVAGLLHEFTDLHWGLAQKLGLLDGCEIYASVALLVLSIALSAAAERRRSLS